MLRMPRFSGWKACAVALAACTPGCEALLGVDFDDAAPRTGADTDGGAGDGSGDGLDPTKPGADPNRPGGATTSGGIPPGPGIDAGTTDAAGPPPLPGTAKVVFVTSTTYAGGSLGGLAGADAKCQARAAAGGLTGTFKAWLSDATTSARDRLTHADVPYVLRDGTRVAADWNQLTSGTLAHSIDATEIAGTPGPLVTNPCGSGTVNAAWTGTSDKGEKLMGGTTGTGKTGWCNDWTNATSQDTATLGYAAVAYVSWSGWCSPGPGRSGCSFVASLYCIEQ